ncbi:hypothetical protein [Spiroplasma kunkelii]|uniref:hypothetical protein n=1 Tax=Spiroplasma kunkelii TaxID=47834 RepID=UPI00130D677A|nr:hypothetical protein [Spiroplasma kunkelii]
MLIKYLHLEGFVSAESPFYTLAEAKISAESSNKNGCLTTIIDLETIEWRR